MAYRQYDILPAGAIAPEIAGVTRTGELLVVFFKITCPVCQFALPFLNRIHPALPVVGVSQNDEADTQEFVEEFGIQFPIVLDPEKDDFPASNAYGISSVPSLFLIEADGRLGRVVEGWRRREMEWLGGRTGAEVILQGENVPEWKAG